MTHTGSRQLVCVAEVHACLCVLLHVCLYMYVGVYVCVLGEERPIKKLPEERAFSWESVGGREDGRAIVCHSSILRGRIRAFLLCSAGRLRTTTDPVFN